MPWRPRGGVKIQLYTFFNLSARWEWWLTPCRGCCSLHLKKKPDTHWIGGWVGPRGGLNGCGKSHTGIRYPDRPIRSESLYRLLYPGPHLYLGPRLKNIWSHTSNPFLLWCFGTRNNAKRSRHCTAGGWIKWLMQLIGFDNKSRIDTNGRNSIGSHDPHNWWRQSDSGLMTNWRTTSVRKRWPQSPNHGPQGNWINRNAF